MHSVCVIFFYKCGFVIKNYYHVVFVFEFVYYDDGFLNIEPSLHPRDEAYLVMIDDHFDVFLHSVCKNFIEYFCMDIHKGNCLKFSFFVGSLCGLGIRVIVASQSTFGFYFVEQFVQNWNQIFFEGLIELCTKPISSWVFFGLVDD